MRFKVVPTESRCSEIEARKYYYSFSGPRTFERQEPQPSLVNSRGGSWVRV